MSERATRECRMSPTIQIFSAVERAEALAQRVDVEQRLRGVLVLAVAGVDDGGRRSSPRRASAAPTCGVRMTIRSGSVGAERLDRVLERLALLDRRAGGAKLMTSADSVLAASSKDERVRVEAS